MKKSVILEKAIVYHKVRNETGTSTAEAPYIGKVELAGVVPQETLVGEMIEDGCSASSATINLVLNTASAVVGDCVGAKGFKVHTGEALVMPHVTGSFPAPDANPGEGNELVPRIDLDDGLRLAAADIVPKENREEISELGGVRILSVFTEGIGFTQLKGTLPFSVAGTGFKPSASSSAAVKVVNAKTGVETEAAEVTVQDNQHIVAQLGSVLAKGDYKVVVTVTDASATGNTEASYNVKMLFAPQPPAPVPIVQSASGDIKVMEMEAVETGMAWAIRGLNVGLSDGGEPNGIVSADATIGGKLVDWLNGGSPFEATEANFTVSEASELPPAGEYVADLTFHRAGGSEGGEDLVVRDVAITVGEP